MCDFERFELSVCKLIKNRYSIFDRTIEENGLKAAAREEGKGIIAFSPLGTGNADRPLSEWDSTGQQNPYRWKIFTGEDSASEDVRKFSN